MGLFIGVVFCIKLMGINGLRNYQEAGFWVCRDGGGFVLFGFDVSGGSS